MLTRISFSFARVSANVQEAHFLGDGLLVQAIFHGAMRQRRIAHFHVPVDHPGGDAQIAVVDESAAAVGEVKLPVEIDDEDDGKLQPLALVDAHHPDDVLAFAQGCRRAHFLPRPFQIVHMTDEVIEARGGKRVKVAGPAPKSAEVPPFAVPGQRRERNRRISSPRRASRSAAKSGTRNGEVFATDQEPPKKRATRSASSPLPPAKAKTAW